MKSSGSAKDYHKGDLATQLWVIRQNELDVASAAIRHIDTSFVLQAVGEYDGIFSDTHLLDEIGDVADGRAEVVRGIREMLADEEPVRSTGPHCTSPFSCEFISHCRADEPTGPEWPIAELPNSGRKLATKWARRAYTTFAACPKTTD
ncbi:MAG: hypothetical protein ACR2O7_17420 [Parasphingorhabdus sp.]